MGYDPGQMQNRWLAGRKLAAGEIDTSADLIPVFGAGERSMSPADYYAAENPTPPPGDLLFEADFTGAGAYTLSGSAATVDDILTHNADWGAWDASTMITSAGLNFQSGVWPTFASVIFDQADGAGLTLVGTVDVGAATISGFLTEINDAPTYAVEDAISISNDEIYIQDSLGSDTAPGVSEGVTSFAMNISPGRMAVSVNGGDVLGRDVVTDTLTLIGMGSAGEEAATLLTLNGRALVSESELPTLSTP